MKSTATEELTVTTTLAQTEIVIGGLVGTVAEHVNLMKREGQSDRCIDYFVGHALGKAIDGYRPSECCVRISEM
jgi:hypothetical protein